MNLYEPYTSSQTGPFGLVLRREEKKKRVSKEWLNNLKTPLFNASRRRQFS